MKASLPAEAQPQTPGSPLSVKDFRHFYYCTSETSKMKVITAITMRDIVSLLYLQRIVFTSHTEKIASTK